MASKQITEGYWLMYFKFRTIDRSIIEHSPARRFGDQYRKLC